MTAGLFAREPATRAVSAADAKATAGDRRAIALLLPTALLVIIGLGAVLSASSVIALRATDGLDKLFFFRRQAIFVAIGIAALVIAARVPYRWYGRWALPLYITGIVGLVATLMIGVERFGATRWIEVGSFTFQPSEFAKFTTIVALAASISRKEKWLHEFSHFFWPVVATLGVVGALVMNQPDLGTTILIGASAMAILLASKAPLRYVFGTAVGGAVIAAALAFAQPYRVARLQNFLDPIADRLGSGLQGTQSLVALTTGGWFGVGLGASRARWFFLPNAHTDFIFAIIGEELGFAGGMTVILLFFMFAIAGTVIAARAPDRFGRLLAVGIVAWLSTQAIVNIAGVVARAPITGVPLPFVSAGGTAMIVNLAAVGVLVNIARSGSTLTSRRSRR